MDRIEFLNKMISESVQETATGFEDLKDFNNEIETLRQNQVKGARVPHQGGNAPVHGLVVYHSTTHSGYLGLMQTGHVTGHEFEKVNAYGRGTYAALNKSNATYNGRSYIIDMYIKSDIINNHTIIPNDNVADLIYNRGALSQEVYTEYKTDKGKYLKRILTDEGFQKAKNILGYYLFNGNYFSPTDTSLDTDFAKEFLKKVWRSGTSWKQTQLEALLDEYEVGAFFYDFGYPAIVIRFTDVATAIRRSTNGNDSINEPFFDEKNEERFDQFNTHFDTHQRLKHKYDRLDSKEVSHGGFLPLVKTQTLADTNTNTTQTYYMLNFYNGRTNQELFKQPIPFPSDIGEKVRFTSDEPGVYQYIFSFGYKQNGKEFVWRILSFNYAKKVEYAYLMNNGKFKTISENEFVSAIDQLCTDFLKTHKPR